jgi:hypothetical protein
MAPHSAFPLAALCVLLPWSTTHGAVDFAQAAHIARTANPGRPLVGIKQRRRDGEWWYATSNINLVNTLTYTLDIDAATGLILGEESEEILPPEDLESAAVLARLPLMQVDFAEALALANQSTARTEADVFRIDLESEFFMLFYQVRYSDGLRRIVDAITGRVHADDDEATLDNAIDPAVMQARIASAQAMAGSAWIVFEASAFLVGDGIATSVLLLNPVNGRVRQVDALGQQATMSSYTPIGRLAEDVAALRAHLSEVVYGPADFLAHVRRVYPGALVGSTKLDSRERNGTVRTRWGAALLTADGQSIEYSLDATQPIGDGVPLVQLVSPRLAGDVDGDGVVGSGDLAQLMLSFGEEYPPHDFDGDGTVGGSDIAFLLRHWTAPNGG